jgi:chromosomal replication initiator protein
MYNSISTHSVNYWVAPILPRKKLNAESIMDATCTVFNISKEELLSKSRTRNIVRARFICMYVIRTKLLISLKEIGVLFGRDHTSVIHAVEVVKNDLSVPAYRYETNESINAVKAML